MTDEGKRKEELYSPCMLGFLGAEQARIDERHLHNLGNDYISFRVLPERAGSSAKDLSPAIDSLAVSGSNDYKDSEEANKV